MKLHKNISSGILRVPKDVRREIGNDIVLHPNTKSAVIYSRDETPERVIKSLEVIIMDLKQDIKGGNDNDGGIEQKQPEKLEESTPDGK